MGRPPTSNFWVTVPQSPLSLHPCTPAFNFLPAGMVKIKLENRCSKHAKYFFGYTVRLHEQLRELEDKRDQLMKEVSTKLTPDEERSRLLKQVKDDHAELATMERQYVNILTASSALLSGFRRIITIELLKRNSIITLHH